MTASEQHQSSVRTAGSPVPGESNRFQYLRLGGLAKIMRFVSTLVILGIGGAIYFFRSYFAFLGNPDGMLLAFVGLFFWTNGVFITAAIIKKPWIFYFNHIGWIAFYIYCAFTTGGVNSSFSFLLVIPLLTSTLDLDARTTKYVGISVVMLYAGLAFFTHPIPFLSAVDTVAYAVKVMIITIIAIYMHRIVKETLRHKFEKEEASKKYYELLEVDQLKSTFATVVSHQLRTPLAGARFGIFSLLRSRDPAKELNTIGPKILERIETAISVLNDIFKTLSIGTENLQREQQTFDLGDLIVEIIEELHDFEKSRGTETSFQPPEPIFVEGDRELLKIACTNVIENAIRYSPNGRVSVFLNRTGDSARIEVVDTGIGILPDDQPHMFERFFRGKNALHLEPNESGVGLYITRQLLAHFLGTIELVQSDEHGTTMAITLPLAKAGN